MIFVLIVQATLGFPVVGQFDSKPECEEGAVQTWRCSPSSNLRILPAYARSE